MSGAGGHGRRPLSRVGATAAIAALVAVGSTVAAVLTASPLPAEAGGPYTARARVPAPVPPSARRHPAGSAAAAARAELAASATPARPGGQAPPTLTAADRRACPAAAMACVDLARHLTWLQSGGLVTFGPVRMEPGPPGTVHQTPRGRFRVAWKAGPGFVSDIYHDAMPWATFFATGGIAFHGGSLTRWSHGCVHLTPADARYYNVHLPVGSEVVVF